MKKVASVFIIVLSFSFSLSAQHQEKAPGAQQANLPEWAQIMYGEKANPEEVQAAYNSYYKTHDFVKNGHTQYYKHWLRNLSRDKNGVFTGSTSWKKAKEKRANFVERSSTLRSLSGPTSNWEGVGPVDWDHDAAERSYAPGAAHVYTVEKAPSNSNILYAGTATAGVWKSIDNGANWVLLTRDYDINGVRALAIDPNDADIVFFEEGGSIYKTINGGTTWTIIGDAAFQAEAHEASDIVPYPGSSSIYFICADDGLYRTADAGSNWTKILGGEFQELEFQPNNSNQVYTIKQVNNNAEFYKSIDGGLTWTIKPNGWPGIASSSSITFGGLSSNGATTDYVSFTNDPEPGSVSLPDFSIELRVKTNGWSSDPAIFSNKNWGSGWNKGFVIAGRGNGRGWLFNISDGSTRIDINGGNINDNTWHHLVVTYDFDGTKSLYQDGVLVNTSTTNISNVVTAAEVLALFQDGTLAYGTGMEMEISDVRIWNTVLSETTIKNWYCQTLNNTHVNYANLIHHWKCEDGAGTTLTDNIGGNNGSLNGTSSWTTSNTIICAISGLITGEEQERVEIAVTADEPNYIYALATGEVNSGSGLFGIYKSIDGGENWTFNCCGPQPGGPASPPTNINMMGWQDDGSDDGGQYYYDLALDVSPVNADIVHVGGVNHWVSTDGGNTFSCPSKWSHPHKTQYVHADIHDIRYFGSELWVAGDGGIFYSTDEGVNFNRRMKGIEGTDFWGFGAGFTNGREVIVGGTYHNGTLLKEGNVYLNGWLSTRGGDNYRGFVNAVDNAIVYDDGGKRKLNNNRTSNFEELSYSMKPNATYVIGESSNIEFDPRNPNTSYSGVGTVIWKTEDDGNNFTSVYDFGVGNELGEIRVAWSDPKTMYACTFGSNDKIWRSTDSGASWTDITPAANSIPYNISVSAEDANTLWAARTVSYTFQGTLNGAKVYQSTNGGASWTNISGSTLDGEYLTNILHQAGTAGGVYVGTRRAVYYKNDALSDFVLFNNELPLGTASTELVANYLAGKLYNGTNRSVYKVDFYETSAPVAQIAVDQFSTLCTGDLLQFYSNSVALDGATYNWSFPTGTPSTSTLKNPIVSFNTTGNHSVELTVTDANGSDMQILGDLISISNDACNPETIPGMVLSTNGTSSSYVYAPDRENLDFGASTDFTLSAWVKTTSTSADAVIMAKKDWDSGANNGWVMAIENGELWVNVGDGSNRIDLRPNELLNDGEWHHVAASFDRDAMATLYLDGINIASTNMTAIENIENSKQFTIGADDEADYPLAAQIEEVCIYNAALTQSEIREQRHLTKKIGTANLVTYLQFNESIGEAIDRKGGGNHCTFAAAATRTTSTCPVGGGESQTLNCSSGGVKDFADVDVSMTFPATGTYPNGDLVVSRLDLNPDQNPVVPNTCPKYWVVNNYGSNSTFSELENIVLSDLSNLPSASLPEDVYLFKRNSNADGNTWGAAIDEAENLTTGANSSATFSIGNSLTSFSQLMIGFENTSVPVELLRFAVQLNDQKEVDLNWETASEIDNDYFVIEKSKDGFSFSELSKVAAQGNSQSIQSYTSLDKNPYRGTSYYRLKQVDRDGGFTYSEIRSITITALASPVVVYPNPAAENGYLNVESDLSENFTISIYDPSGKLLKTEAVDGGSKKISLETLSRGAFYYQIKGEQFLKNGLFVIE